MTPDSACPVCGAADAETFHTPWDVSLRSCRECGVRFVYPLPDPSLLRDRYQEEHAQGKWARVFHEASGAERRRRARLVRRHAHGASGSLLDVGFGDGSFLDEAAGAGWATLGVEIAPAAAREVGSRHAVFAGTLEAVAPTAKLEAVTFWDVLEHVPDPGGLIREAARRLEVGGVVAVTMPNVRGTEARVYGRRWRYYDLATYGHLHHLSPGHVERLLSDRGLTVVHRETRGSADLRDLLGPWGEHPVLRPLVWLLDRASGVMARVAEPRGWGNTILVIGRKEDA